jgi:hypothetical protein
LRVSENRLLRRKFGSKRKEVTGDWRRLHNEEELRIFLFTTASRTALEPTQPPVQWVRGAPPLGVKGLGREADH